MKIILDADNLERFAEVIKQLVMRGLGFEVREKGGFFEIVFNGGF